MPNRNLVTSSFDIFTVLKTGVTSGRLVVIRFRGAGSELGEQSDRPRGKRYIGSFILMNIYISIYMYSGVFCHHLSECLSISMVAPSDLI